MRASQQPPVALTLRMETIIQDLMTVATEQPPHAHQQPSATADTAPEAPKATDKQTVPKVFSENIDR